MKVLKIVAEGLTTSFRYPHFMLQVHPSFQMPPPATIYGHICSALGEWFDPSGVQFAYHFTHQGHVRDIEHIVVLAPPKSNRSKLPGTKIPNVLEGNVNPFERELLFQPRLTLYINRPEWAAAFRSPRYAVCLGRAQDLFTYTEINVVELHRSEHVYFEHTIIPHQMGHKLGRGVSVLMPRYLDYNQNRRPQFSQYTVLTDRVSPSNGNTAHWIDPVATEYRGNHLGLVFHNFVGDEDATAD